MGPWKGSYRIANFNVPTFGCRKFQWRQYRQQDDLFRHSIIGIFARFACAFGNQEVFACAPLIVFPNFHPPIGPHTATNSAQTVIALATRGNRSDHTLSKARKPVRRHPSS